MPVQPTDDFLGPIPTLPQLLKQLNNALGWRPAQMAAWMKKDTSEISRLLLGKVKPHRETLAYYAQRYRDAGLEGVTVEILIEARDKGGKATASPYDIPPQWLRLVQLILTFDQDAQDTYYRLFYSILQETSRLVFRQRPTMLPPSDDDDIPIDEADDGEDLDTFFKKLLD